jgi:hypothetical protein
VESQSGWGCWRQGGGRWGVGMCGYVVASLGCSRRDGKFRCYAVNIKIYAGWLQL